MDVTCISDVFHFIHRVMYLEMDETVYYDDSEACEEVPPDEDNEG